MPHQRQVHTYCLARSLHHSPLRSLGLSDLQARQRTRLPADKPPLGGVIIPPMTPKQKLEIGFRNSIVRRNSYGIDAMGAVSRSESAPQ